MSKLKRMLSGRTALALGVWVGYVLAFIPLYRLVGSIVASLAILPVVVTGWLFGIRAGLLAGLLTFPLNMLLTAMVTGTVWEMMTPGGLFGSVLILLIGAVVGRLHDLGEQVKWELAERKQAEEALKEHSERLEEMVEERTAELKTINEQLRLEITERKRAEEALMRRAVQLATLNRIGRHVASILDQQKLLQDAVDAVQEDLGYLQAAVLLVDEEASELYVAVATDNFWEIIPDEYRQPVGKGAIGIAAETEETVLVCDAAGDSRVYRAGDWFSPSSLSVPIGIGGQVIGVLEVEADVPNAFDENDQATLEIMADQVAIAIKNAQLYEEIEERRLYLEGVLKAAPDAIVTQSAHHRIVEWNVGAERLFGYSREEVLGQDIDDLVTNPDVFEEAVGFTQTVMGGGEIVPVETVRYRKDGSPVDIILAASPILVEGESIGMVTVYTDITERKRMEEALKWRNRELATLYEAATAISSDLSLNVVLQAVAEQMTQTLGSSGCALSLWKQDEDLIVTLVDYDKDYPDDTEPPGTTYHLSDYPVTRRVLETGRPVVIRRDDPTADEAELALMEKLEVPILLMLPLIARDRVLGLIELTDYVEARQYTPQQIRLAESLAAQAAIAIENARLYEEIGERRMYLEGVLRAAPDAIVTLDARHQIVEWNSGAERLFEYSREEVIGQDIDDLITDPDVLKEAVGLTQIVMGREEVPPLETVRYRKDGSLVDVIVAGSPILVGDEFIGVVAVYTDITERKRAEEVLRQREAILRAIALAAEKFLRPSDWEQDMQVILAYLGKAADVSRASIWEASTSDDGKCLLSDRYEWLASEAKLAPLQGLRNVPVFRRWRDILPCGEIVAGHVRDFGAKEQEFFVPRGIKSVLAVPIFVNGVWWGFMGFDQGGTEREWMEAEIDALKTAASIFGGALERKWAEEALAKEQSLLRALLDNSPDAIYFKDTDSRFIRTNRAHAERWFGLSDPAQAIGKTDFDFFSEEHARKAYEDEQEIIRTGQPLLNMEERETWPDRPDTWVLTSKMPLRDEEGKITGTFGITKDITERKRAEEQLQRYAVELERANEEVKQFAYIVSHDLRAPLVNLKGFSTELRFALETVDSAMDTALSHLDEKQRQDVTLALEEDIPEALGFIDSSVIQMDRFISALLKLSRLGRRELHLESVDMEAPVQEVLETLAHQIEERQVRVTVGPLPEVVADRTSMEQIMGNILTNAVKYLAPDRPGEIEITAERSDEETTFRIRDNGRGIAEEDISKVFVPFRRVGRQDVPGEGMGLAYVQALVRQHGGRIWCESELGAGTTFSFTISKGL